MEQSPNQHFLVVSYPAQGHLNPSLHLARKLARLGALVTFSTTVSAHRRLFPDGYPPDKEISDGEISYLPFSDGQDDVLNRQPFDEFYLRFRRVGSRNLSKLIADLKDGGRPVTCVFSGILTPWAVDVAREHSIPSALYWIQPVSVFAIYYHYFRGDPRLITDHVGDPSASVSLPGLPPIQVNELPTFFTDPVGDPNGPNHIVLSILRDMFGAMEKETKWPKPKVLVNSLAPLEEDVISAIEAFDLVMVGPFLPSSNDKVVGDLFDPDGKGYMDWLDAKPENSAVYMSFGSMANISRRQMEEITRGLKDCGRPYLLVVRKDNELVAEVEELSEDKAMVVEWCNQIEVLSHRSVGCFLSHCGWNSTMEGLTAGVPVVGFPQWSDQRMNARMVEEVAKTGVRVQTNEEGILEAELRRCLEVVMGDGERALEIRNNAKKWKEKMREAGGEGGSSDRNIRAFVEDFGN